MSAVRYSRGLAALTLTVAVGCSERSGSTELPLERSEGATAPAPTAAATAPTLDAASTASAPEIAPPRAPRRAPHGYVYARTRFVWIRPQPGEGSGWIGYLWTGGAAPLKTGSPLGAPGCAKSWYELVPRGFVCVDDVKATLDERDPVLARLAPYTPRLGSAWPHHYGESRGVERYAALPSPEEQRRREWDLPQQQERLTQAAQGKTPPLLEGVDLTPAPEQPIELGALPPVISEPRTRLLPLSTVAWSAETRVGERSFLLSADMMWVPKDRVAPYPKITFKGVRLGGEEQLPLAFFRSEGRPKYRREGEAFITTGDAFARLSHVGLTGQAVGEGKARYLETREPGVWVLAADAVVPTPRPTTPWGAPVGEADTTGKAPPGRATWTETSVWQGWLIAYEGTRPVYVTLVSPGRGGTPERGKPAIDTASTPVGVFKITGKFATATMVAPGDFIHSDVPWTQNFSGPHALHGAYWHDNWGNRMSAGCVNVSPEDGKWLYEFTEPTVPEGWHGLRWQPELEPATTFVVHE